MYILRRSFNLSKLLNNKSLIDYYRNYLKKFLGNEQDTVKILRRLEICIYMRNQLLRDTDWASMYNSHEVRVPFVDKNFFQKLETLENFHKKYFKKLDLKKLFSPQIDKKFLNRPKTGFATPLKSRVEKIYKIKFESRSQWSDYVLEKYLEKWKTKCNS